MAKKKEIIFVCSNCGNEFGKWAGQCSMCGEWNSLREVSVTGRSSSGRKRENRGGRVVEVKRLSEVKNRKTFNIFSSKISELDRVLGKGVVPGSVILFSGEPGIGKSTLLTQLIGRVGGLYVAGEESAEQIKLRFDRLGLKADKAEILETNVVDDVLAYFDRVKELPNLIVVDSIQVMALSDLEAATGSVSQIRESAFVLIQLAKEKGVPIVIVGHVTKEGSIAGPKLLEHMVDVVLYFEGEKTGEFRILRSIKNRFGPTDEVGIFKMEAKGLREVTSDEVNLASGKNDKVGAIKTIVMEGSRPMMVEVQALVTESFAPIPKRVFSGVDFKRGQLLVAVAQKVLGIPLYKYDVYVSVTGGVKLTDTGSDLAVVAAMWSSFKNKIVGIKKVLVGEVSLLGEVVGVRQMEKRNKESKVLGREVWEMGSIRELKQ